jgi:hypothetical protein
MPQQPGVVLQYRTPKPPVKAVVRKAGIRREARVAAAR